MAYGMYDDMVDVGEFFKLETKFKKVAKALTKAVCVQYGYKDSEPITAYWHCKLCFRNSPVGARKTAKDILHKKTCPLHGVA